MKKRVPISRMMQIHEQLMTGRYPNRRNLSERFEISQKTIQRDIDFMRDQLGLPIEYDEKRYGFYYAQPVHHFPTIEASEGEIMALYIAQRALTTYQGTPLEETLGRAFKKITDSLNDKISFSPDSVDSSISFRQNGYSISDLEIFERISEATIRSKEVVFEYHKLQGRGYEERHVRPYHLASVQNEWYLYAFDLKRDGMRTFALPRMRSIQILEKNFTRPENFKLEDYLSDSFGVRAGGGKYRVRIRFYPPVSRFIAERQWHKSQILKKFPNGDVELQMTLGSLTEVKKWILGWGDRAKVLAPRELIVRIKKDIEGLGNYYLDRK